MTRNSRQRIRGILLRKLRYLGVCIARLQQNTRIPAPNDLGHAGEIVLAVDRSHPITAVIVFIRHAVPKTNHRGNNVRRGNI